MTDIVERLRSSNVRMGVRDPNDYGMTITVAEANAAADEIERLRAERDEAIATPALYRAENGCTRGQRTTQWCGEASKLRRAWLRVIQQENSCPATGGGCLAKRCGCIAEMEMLVSEGEASHD
ncbi:hypothetical protein [Falsiroseomonas sp.]|uniref:hypothetical protein n=1 Tax=Falsiroseomonas sp. TaxID=2870721 RepID=UPI0034A2C7B7